MARSSIPVLVVAGYLGSGKTTLLNHLLRGDHGARIGVVVNDFGAVNIDSMLVASQVDSMVSLGNGCICCAVDPAEFDDLLATLTAPGRALDAIVVEASGLAEPRNLIRSILATENPGLHYGGLLLLIDAANWSDTSVEHPELTRHLAFADLVVLNKIDLVAPGAAATLEASLRERVGSIPVVAVSGGAVDARGLFEIPERAEDLPRQLSLEDLLRESHVQHLHHRFDVVCFETDDPLEPRRFVEMLEDPPSGLYRAKGFVDFGIARYQIHTVGRHIRIVPASGRGTSWVSIGAGIDTAEVEGALRGAITARPVPRDALLPIQRYLVPELG